MPALEDETVLLSLPKARDGSYVELIQNDDKDRIWVAQYDKKDRLSDSVCLDKAEWDALKEVKIEWEGPDSEKQNHEHEAKNGGAYRQG